MNTSPLPPVVSASYGERQAAGDEPAEANRRARSEGVEPERPRAEGAERESARRFGFKARRGHLQTESLANVRDAQGLGAPAVDLVPRPRQGDCAGLEPALGPARVGRGAPGGC